MIKEILESLEDPRKPLLGPNYLILKQIGLMLPDNKCLKFWYIVLHEITVFFVITEYMELYVVRSDLNLVLDNLKVSILGTITIFKSHVFILFHNNWRELFEYATAADLYERNHINNEKKIIIDRYTRYCRRATYSYWTLVFVTILTTVFMPLIKYETSDSYRENLRNGSVSFAHIYSSWVPFDKNHSPGIWITIMWHVFLTASGSVTMAAFDSATMVMFVFFGGKMDILRVRCKQMLGIGNAEITEEEANIKVRQLHGVHMLLMKYSKLFNSLLSPLMFMYVVMCSLMICASAFQLTTTTNTTQKLLMAEYLIFGIAQLFVFCLHSNNVIVKNENLMMGPYESAWWAASIRQRKNILLLAGQLKTVRMYTAGPFTNLTLSTFITILKGAYSYYTLLRD